VTQAKNETIEIFCRELALELKWITDEKIDIQPDLLTYPMEDIQHPVNAQIPLADRNGLLINERSNGYGKKSVTASFDRRPRSNRQESRQRNTRIPGHRATSG